MVQQAHLQRSFAQTPTEGTAGCKGTRYSGALTCPAAQLLRSRTALAALSPSLARSLTAC